MNAFATVDGRIIVVAGKSRAGKSARTSADVADCKRILAWDSQDQWAELPGWHRVASQAELSALLLKVGSKQARIAYVHQDGDIKDAFDKFSRKALTWGEVYGPCVVIAEELADVSSPGKAPEGWGMLVRTGLKRGITIYAISQRWAEADKTAFNNVSEFVCVQMAPMDIEYMAKRTGIAPEELAALKKVETASLVSCPFIRVHADSGQIERGVMKFRKKPAK